MPWVDPGLNTPTPVTVLDETTPIWETYLDWKLDVKPYLQFDATNTTYDAQLPLLTDFACQWVQNYLSQPVAPMEFFRRFDGGQGWNASHIMLPYRPVLSIVNITEWWGSSGPHVLAQQTPESQGVTDMYQVSPLTGRLSRTFMGLIQRPFFPGSRNIEVTWTAGYNPVPSPIRMATLEFANYWFRNTQEAPRTSALAINEYDNAGPGSLWPAVPNRVTALLEPYRQFLVA